jgi:uncharacterized membrane protein YqjE
MSLSSEFSPLGAIALLRSAGSALAAQASLHAQLAKVEWAEEKLRITQIAIAGLVGFMSVQCLLMSVGLIALMLSWRTPYEIPVMVTVSLGYLILCALAVYVLRRLGASSATSFAATRQEIAADLAMLRATLSGVSPDTQNSSAVPPGQQSL